MRIATYNIWNNHRLFEERNDFYGGCEKYEKTI